MLTALEQLRAADPGGVLSPLSETDRELSGGWRRVITEPTAFSSLGLATARWVRENGPALADAAVIDGPCPTHQDLRSDNLCIRGERALLVDWNLAVLAHADYDIAFWLPSLHAEGGPAPEEILPDAGPLAAVISGFFRRTGRQAEDPDGAAGSGGAAPAAPHRAAVGGARAGAGAARRAGGGVGCGATIRTRINVATRYRVGRALIAEIVGRHNARHRARIAQQQGLHDGALEVIVGTFDAAVFDGPCAVVARGAHAVVGVEDGHRTQRRGLGQQRHHYLYRRCRPAGRNGGGCAASVSVTAVVDRTRCGRRWRC